MSRTSQTINQHWGLTFSILIVFTLALLVTTSFLKNRFNRSHVGLLKSSIDALSSNMSERSEGKHLKEVQETKNPSSAQNESKKDDGKYINEMPVSSLQAYFWDSYWSHFDDEAAFAWDLLLPGRRADLLKTDPELEPYVSSLAGFSPLPHSRFRDANYLNPLPLNHLGNAELTKAVRSTPSVVSFLSEMRKSELQLSGMEFLKLQRSKSTDKSRSDVESILTKHGPSKKRTFAGVRIIPIKSIADEEQILESSDLSIAEKSAIRSLAWFNEMPEDKIKNIFTTLSAQDLAEAWIGPESVLNALSQHLPEKKLKMVQSYLNRVTPSRDSAAFEYLFSESLEHLQQQSNDMDVADYGLKKSA